MSHVNFAGLMVRGQLSQLAAFLCTLSVLRHDPHWHWVRLSVCLMMRTEWGPVNISQDQVRLARHQTYFAAREIRTTTAMTVTADCSQKLLAKVLLLVI
jgi:hypothetical protein